MAIYTVCSENDGYEVTVCRSLDALWKEVANDDHFLDTENEIPLTKSGLKREIKSTGEARIYDAGAGDWIKKIQAH